MQIDIFGIIFAIFIAAGGVFGYVKTGSVPSLVAGLIFGAILGVGAYFNSQNPRQPLIQLITLIVLSLVMYFRWYKTSKLMPAGMIAIISTIVFAVSTGVYWQDLRNQLS